jgi:hypothetical protein
MKMFYFYIFVIIIINVCNGQIEKKQKKEHNQIDLSFIQNKKMKYTIVLKSCDSCIPIKNIGYRVILSLNNNQKDIIKKIEKRTWIKLLHDNDKDFAANLILYSINNRDAFLLTTINSEEEWRKYLKEKDLEYWIKNLK